MELGDKCLDMTGRLHPSSPPPGLEGGRYIQIAFSGSGQYYNKGYITIEVFDNVSDAQSHYADTQISHDNGITITPTNDVPYAPSGFSSSQQAQCRTDAVSAGAGSGATGYSACQVQWGNVVVFGNTIYDATQADPQPGSADNDMALTLAKSALLFIGQLMDGNSGEASLGASKGHR